MRADQLPRADANGRRRMARRRAVPLAMTKSTTKSFQRSPGSGEGRRYGVHEAKTRLSELIRLVELGEAVEIERNGVLVARLVAPDDAPTRRFGTLRGQATIAQDFDDPLPVEMHEAFGG